MVGSELDAVLSVGVTRLLLERSPERDKFNTGGMDLVPGEMKLERACMLGSAGSDGELPSPLL